MLPKWPTHDFSHEDKTTTLGDDRARYPLSLLCDRIFGQVRKQGKYPHKPMTWCSISNKKKTGKNSKAKKTLWFNSHPKAKASKALKEHKKKKQIHIHIKETNANSCANFRIPLAHILPNRDYSWGRGSDLYIFVYGVFPADLLIKGSKNVIKQVLEISRMLSNKSNLQKGYLTPEQCAHTMTPRARSNFSNVTRGRFCFEKLQIYVFVGETYFHAVWARSDPCFLLKPQTSKY